MHTFYPQARGAFTGYEIRRSSVDPSTGGAYLAFGPGQMSKYWRLWERPLQRVAFAGEHTDALYPGTLEGALRTGQRAASQVQDLAAGKSFEPVKVAPPKTPEAAPKASGGVGAFFSNMFGGSKPEAKPAEKAPEPAPAPAAVTPPPAPVVEPAKPTVVEPAKKTPVKKEPAKKEPVKKAPAKPAATHKAPAKTDATKKAPAKAVDKAATPAAPAVETKN